MSVTIIRIICCLLVVLLPFPAESRAATPEDERPHPVGGTLVWGSVSAPVPFNPTQNVNGIVMGLQDLVFNRLIRLNAEGNYEPDLAESWEISADKLIYTFYLRENIRFHDGTALTAEDVKFTYERILDPARESPFRPDLALIERMEIPDPDIVRFILKEPDPLLINHLDKGILPKHLLSGDESQQLAFYDSPVGTGPFQFLTWGEDRSSLVLTANTNYFEGRPYLDKIRVEVYSDNSALWKAFMRRDVDIVEYINYEDYRIAAQDSDFRVYAMEWGMYSVLLFNTADPVWQDRELRGAVSHAINREQIFKILGGEEYEANELSIFNSELSTPPEKQPAYNPARAAAILEAQGWQLMPTGIRRKDGRDLELRVLVDGRNATDRKLVRIIRQDLAQVGIRTKVQLFNDNAQLLTADTWDAPPQAWLRYIPDWEYHKFAVLEFWYSGSPEPVEICSYRNEKVDKLIEEVYRLSDEKQTDKLLQDILRLVQEDYPAVYLYFPKSYFAVSSRLKNTDAFFTRFQPPYSIKDWYIAQTGARLR